MKIIFIVLVFLSFTGCYPATTDSGGGTPPVLIIDADEK